MKNINIKKLFTFFFVSYISLVIVIFYILQEISYSYTFENLQDNLRNTKALRHFVSAEQKEEVYALQKGEIVSKEYFRPQLLSSSYCSTAANRHYNNIREKDNLEPIILRFASDNPRNPANKTTAYESNILKQFNDKKFTEYKEVKYNKDGKKVLYYAIPTKPLGQKCMRCHSTPDKAPKDLVRIYGDKNGFYEKVGTIRAFISTEYPLEDTDSFVLKSTFLLGAVTLFIFILFAVFYLRFSKKILDTNEQLQELNLHLEDEIAKETHALETSNLQLESVIKGSDLGYWDWNLQTGNHEVNQKWLDILGLEKSDITNDQKDWENRVHQEDQKRIIPIIKKAMESDKTYTVEFRMKHKDGHYVWIEGSGGVIERDSYEKPLRACGTHRDITKRKTAELELLSVNKQLKLNKEELERLAITDKLTNLFNRHKLDQVLEEEKKRADRYSNSFGIILLDIDRFKSVNDTYGHHVGDSVLQEFSKILLENSRKTDIIGRWGGEEFMIIVPQAQKDSLLQFATSLREKINETSFTTVGKVTASMGASLYIEKESFEMVVSRADEALYLSKNKGRDQININ